LRWRPYARAIRHSTSVGLCWGPPPPKTLPTHRLIIIRRHYVTVPTCVVGMFFRATTLRYDNNSHLRSGVIISITLATPIIFSTAWLSAHPHRYAQSKAYLHDSHYQPLRNSYYLHWKSLGKILAILSHHASPLLSSIRKAALRVHNALLHRKT